MTETAVIESVRKWAAQFPNQKAAADDLGISAQYLGEILKGTRHISEPLAHKLGYNRVVSYEPRPPSPPVDWDDDERDGR